MIKVWCLILLICKKYSDSKNNYKYVGQRENLPLPVALPRFRRFAAKSQGLNLQSANQQAMLSGLFCSRFAKTAIPV